ncbi:MAG TPA: hypothetical protein VFR08_08520 [Candidatus Angelobacter sp.]|nr:hypothetical protein [Candidatus Angelobacter sp.]
MQYSHVRWLQPSIRSAYSLRITARISRQTIHGILRVIAFILLCIGGQIAWNGVQQLVLSVSKH